MQIYYITFITKWISLDIKILWKSNTTFHYRTCCPLSQALTKKEKENFQPNKA